MSKLLVDTIDVINILESVSAVLRPAKAQRAQGNPQHVKLLVSDRAEDASTRTADLSALNSCVCVRYADALYERPTP